MAKLFTFLMFIVVLFLIGFLVFSLIKAFVKWIDKDAEIKINELQRDYEKRVKEEECGCTCDSTCEVGPDTIK